MEQPSLEELIPEQHLVRVVNRVVGELGNEPPLAKYIRRRDQQLSSEDDVESDRVCLHPEDLFIAEDRKSAPGKHWIYADRR